MASDHEFDRIIDRALTTYSEAQPLEGLADRVLNRVRGSGSTPRRFRGWEWVVTASGLVVLASIVFTLEPRRGTVPKEIHPANFQAATQPVLTTKSENAQLEPSPRLREVTRTKHPMKRYFLPKQEQFPSPTPLSSEERVLVAFVKRDPARALKLFASSQNDRADQEIQIEPIQIKPLADDGAQ